MENLKKVFFKEEFDKMAKSRCDRHLFTKPSCSDKVPESVIMEDTQATQELSGFFIIISVICPTNTN